MAQIVDSVGVAVVPETAEFAADLRSDIERDLTAATAGLDKTVEVRVVTDSAAAEKQIRAALARVQQTIDRVIDRTRARATQLYQFLEQRVVIRLANKIREWTQRTIGRVKLLMEPFWKYLRVRLDQVRRGWATVQKAAGDAADAVSRRWTQALAVMSAQMSRVRGLGARLFSGIADAAEPHLARLQRGLSGLAQRATSFGRASQQAFAVFRSAAGGAERAARAVAAAEREVEAASDAARDAHDREQAAIIRVTAAAARLSAAREAQARAQKAVATAERALNELRTSGSATAEELSDAEDALSIARERLGKTTASLIETEAKHSRTARDHLAIVDDVAEAERILADRHDDLAAAQDRVTTASTRFQRVAALLGRGVRNVGLDLRNLQTATAATGRGLARLGSRFRETSLLGRTVGRTFTGVGKIMQGVSGTAGSLFGSLKLVGGGLLDLGRAGLSAVGVLAKFGGIGVLIGAVLGGVTFAVGAAGAAFAGLPALVGAAAVSFGVFKLGMDGIKRAYESSLKPAIEEMGDQIEGVFERKLTPAFQRLSRELIPQITDGMTGLAAEFADAGVAIMDMVNRADNIANINTLIENLIQVVRGQLSPALQNIIQAFINISANGAILRDIVGIFTDLTNRTAGWLDEMNRSGQAERSLGNLRSVLDSLVDLFYRLLTGAMQFFDEATPGMNSLLDSINPNESIMRRLGKAFGDAAQAAADFINNIPPGTVDKLTTAAEKLASALGKLANSPGVISFLENLATVAEKGATALDGIASAVTGVADAVSGTLGFFDELLADLRDVTNASAPGATAAETYAEKTREAGQAAADAGGQIGGALPPAFDEAAAAAQRGGQGVQEGFLSPVQALPADAGAAIAPLPGVVNDPMAQAAKAAELQGQGVQAGFVPPVAAVPGDAGTALAPLEPAVQGAMDASIRAAEDGGRRVQDSVRAGMDGAAAAAEGAMPRVADSVTRAMDAAAAAADGGGRRVSDAVRAAGDAAAGSMEGAMARVADAVTRATAAAAAAAEAGGRRIADGLRSSADSAAASVEAGMTRMSTAVEQGMQRAVTAAQNGGRDVETALRTSLESTVRISEESWRRIVTAFEQGGRRAVESARATGRDVVAAFEQQAGPMYNAGQTLIRRLTDGMIAQGAAATAAAARIAASIKAQFPASPAKEGPLSGAGDPLRAGGTIVARLTDGMARAAPAAVAQTRSIGAQLVDQWDITAAGIGRVLAGIETNVRTVLSRVESMVARIRALAAQAGAAGGAEVQVRYGTVPDAVWDRLLAMGYRGRPNDRAEALYVPANVLAQARNGGRQIGDAFAGALGIRSPSRVFERFGADLMEGLRLGVAGQESAVLAQVRVVGDRLVAVWRRVQLDLAGVTARVQIGALSAQSPMVAAARDILDRIQSSGSIIKRLSNGRPIWQPPTPAPPTPRLVGVESGPATALRPDAANARQGGADTADAVGAAVYQALHKARLEVDGTGLARVVAKGNRDLARR